MNRFTVPIIVDVDFFFQIKSKTSCRKLLWEKVGLSDNYDESNNLNNLYYEGKQDDKNSTAMREIQSQHLANKKCFDCDQRGPTYVNMTIGSFVCTKCSGLLRGDNPADYQLGW